MSEERLKITKKFMILFNRTLSLVELLVVLTLCLILTGVTSTLFSIHGLSIGADDQSAHEVLTKANFQTIFKAIMGEGSTPGFFQDLGFYSDYMPHTLADLFRVPERLPSDLQHFDPFMKRGWRGPYLVSSGRYGEMYSQKFRFRAGFGAIYGEPSDSAVLDAWGNPIVLQIDFDGDSKISREEAKYARLVSAGRNQILETPYNVLNQIPGSNALNQLTLKECGDDLVLFLQINDLRE